MKNVYIPQDIYQTHLFFSFLIALNRVMRAAVNQMKKRIDLNFSRREEVFAMTRFFADSPIHPMSTEKWIVEWAAAPVKHRNLYEIRLSIQLRLNHD